MRSLFAVAMAGAVITLAPRAAASPQEVIGFGYRSIGMGGTGAAGGRGVDTVYANPALLSLSHELSLELGSMGAAFDLHAPQRLSYAPLRANTIGGLLPLPFGGALKDRVTIGLGFLTPYDVVVRARILYPEQPQVLLADRVQSVAVQLGLGIDIGWGLRVGGGFAALAALSGSVLVATDASGRIGTVVEDTLVASYAPIFGASYDLGERWRLGVTGRGELEGRFDVVIRADDLGAVNIPPLHVSGVAQYDPWQAAAELAYADEDWSAALQLTYKHWSAYPGPSEATVRCEDSPDPELVCGAPIPPDPGFSPVVAPRVGGERRWALGPAEVELRAGYGFEPSPAPEQTGRSSYYDSHRSVLAFGWGVRLVPAPIRFDGFTQLSFLHAREHHKTVAGGAARDEVVESHGTVLAAGASAAVNF